MNLESFPDQMIVDAGAERNALVCILKSIDAWLRLPNGFGASEFAIPLNRAIFSVVDSIYNKGAVADPVTVYESLPRDYQKELDEVGGWSYLQALKDTPLDPINIQLQVTKLVELATKRRIEEAGKQIASLPYSGDTLESMRERIELAILGIDKDSDDEVLNIATNGMDYIDRKMANKGENPGLPSGMNELDRITQGFQPGRLYVVGARKKTGKSMILLNWAKYLSIDMGVPILWISTEHTIDDEFSRILALTSNVREEEITNGEFAKIEKHVERVADAYEQLRKSPFHFASMPFFSLEKIRRLARKMARTQGVKILFFDYIKAPENDAGIKEWQELGSLTYGLKTLGVVENIPVVSAVQINREGQAALKNGGDIESDNFAGSDRIAQAASVTLVMREPTEKEVLGEYRDQFRLLRCTDNRHGKSGGKILLDFNGETSLITENRRI